MKKLGWRRNQERWRKIKVDMVERNMEKRLRWRRKIKREEDEISKIKRDREEGGKDDRFERKRHGV